MIHRWITTDAGHECLACGLTVAGGPFEAGQYPMTCEARSCRIGEDGHARRHHVTTQLLIHPDGSRVSVGECHYCGEFWS